IVILIKAETCWTDFPNVGFSVKPNRRLSKNGRWQHSDKQLLRRFPEVELLTCQEGSWYYLGTYAVTTKETLSVHEFQTLPQEARQELVAQAGHKTHHAQLWAMFQAGQLSGTRFTLERVSFN
ncbi:hypothetical protein FOMPIDRAFT_1088065, partial [Fomitopsis schrenkii]